MKPKHFRILITISILLTVLSIVSDFAFISTLPPELQRFVENQENVESTAEHMILVLLFVPVFIGLIVGYVGLYMFKNWARFVYTYSMAGAYLYPFLILEPSVINAYAYGISSLATVLDGVLIAVLFFSETIKSQFIAPREQLTPQRDYLSAPPPSSK